MRDARFDNPKEVEYEMRRRYELSLRYLKYREGLSLTDEGIQVAIGIVSFLQGSR
jgi:hypothetical protein